MRTITRRSIVTVLLAILVIVAILVAIRWGYLIAGTGFSDYTSPTGEFQRGKTLWDWMALLIIPIVLAFGAIWFSWQEKKAERQIASDQSRETALQAYLDTMTELLLDKGLRESDLDDEIRSVARARTLTVLRKLDGERKGILLRFLHESGLISDKAGNVVALHEADLNGADLSLFAKLEGANLSKADLHDADMVSANLSGANLSEAILSSADLTGVVLIEARLTHAYLNSTRLVGADLSKADLKWARLHKAKLVLADLRGANLNDADLRMADLSRAKLASTDLSRAELSGADLRMADLTGAQVTDKQLAQAKSLKGAIMPDGTMHK